ncbi:MAG: hypothetical protein GF315_04335 [candidate division Zixibacteria bacterium]|nr:hypothetical protein [candidate division Zixibacteria bacterium]
MKKAMFSVILLFLLSPVTVLINPVNAELSAGKTADKTYLTAYQSNDDRIWHIYCKRFYQGEVDSFRISPEIDAYDQRMGYSEPILMGDSSLIYCAMLVHKQVVGDSAYNMVMKSTDIGDTWEIGPTVGKEQAIARHLSAELRGDVIRLMWEDCRSGSWRIYYEEIDVF